MNGNDGEFPDETSDDEEPTLDDLDSPYAVGKGILDQLARARVAAVRLSELDRHIEGDTLRNRALGLDAQLAEFPGSLIAISTAFADLYERTVDEVCDSVVYHSLVPGVDGLTDALNTQLNGSENITATQILIVPEVRNVDGKDIYTSQEELQAVVDALHTQLEAQGRDDYEILIGAEPYVIDKGEVKGISFDLASRKHMYGEITGAKLYKPAEGDGFRTPDVSVVEASTLETKKVPIQIRNTKDMMVVSVASAREGGSLESLVGGLIPSIIRREGLNHDLMYAAKGIAGADGDVNEVYRGLITAVGKKVEGNDDKYGRAVADVRKDGGISLEEFTALMEEAYRAMDSQALVDLARHIQETRNTDSLYIVTSDNGTVVGKRVMGVDAAATTKLSRVNLEDTVYAGKTGDVMVVPIATEASKRFIAEQAAKVDYTTNISSWRININSERSYTDGVAEVKNTAINYDAIRGFLGHKAYFNREVTATPGEAYLLLTEDSIHCYGITHTDEGDNKEHYFQLSGDQTELEGLVDLIEKGDFGENLSELARQVFTTEDQPIQDNLFEELATLYIKRPDEQELIQRYVD